MHGLAIRDRAPEAIADLEKAGEALDVIAARLAVRLGTSNPITVAFDEADAEVLDLYRAVTAIFGDEEPPERPGVRNSVRNAGTDFDARRAAFVAAATSSAGSRLPTER